MNNESNVQNRPILAGDATMIGVGYRAGLADWVATRPEELGCLEITAEHFFDGDDETLHELAANYPLFVHGLGLSLGTPGPLDSATLDAFARVTAIADPEWISEHVAFTRSDEVDLGHLNPIAPTQATLRVVADHARAVSEHCGKPIILENITSHLRLDGELREPDFLNRLCEKADCGLLLDVTNLFINSRNHRFDPSGWLGELDPRHIVQLHVVGYTQRDGRFEDFHSENIQSDLWALIGEVCRAASIRAIIIERDDRFPPPKVIRAELAELGRIANQAKAGLGSPV